ncbi:MULTISPECIES: trypsin-like peptidase domain-containing protein [Micromonospora]|uniref:Peptidase S1 n=1 Tax=Micromonospora maris TaxID=1003110 RepID=A0A9X0I3P2_9ACTN|nr:MULTISPECIES: trypsin-like peptidase domain-containing protein [Micromonospora]AEB47055.1 peptidase S1 and S6, chymotrypsin/Hap [Micromonospora maris AB-18-032]KUJ46185.1 peptidase S1 [Micromonospora maris]RUL93443.1 PDZ domain-containing protein [Verrucosispora sp. FIM060022]
MTEYESDPRRPAPTDAEPSHPELPRAEYARSDSPTEPVVGSSADPTAESPTIPVHAVETSPAGNQDAEPTMVGLPVAGMPPPPQTGPSSPAPGQPAQAPDQPAPQAPGQPAPQGQPVAGQHPWGPAGSQPYQPGSRYPAAPWYPGQSGWAGSQQPSPGGHPGYPGQPSAGYPGQPGAQTAGYPGQLPPWAAPQQSVAGPRPGRIAKFVGAGVAVFALMLGSGIAGGTLALALSDGGTVTRTFSAAPVIDGADLPRIAAAVQDSVVSITTGSGEGSGVVLTADGYVLTNNHVIAEGGDTVRVIFANGTNAQADVIGTDPRTDLAVLKANGVSDLKAATFGDSDAMQVGDQVLALGSPLGLQGSVTAGILSARDRTIQAGSGDRLPGQAVSSISGLLQTDAPINPGNSGGALVNTRGEVIGINTAIATAGQGNTGNIGVGFAIPSNKAKDIADKLQRREKISHPSLGVSVTGTSDGGALINAVTPGSAAERAGLERGDVITRFGDKVINDSNDLVGAVQAGKVGDQVEVTFQRNGAEATATVTLAEAS